MSDVIERIGIGRAWAASVALLAAVFGLGSILFTRTVYANFVWHYFWGPVYADAKGWSCAAWANGEQIQPQSCTNVPAGMGPVAEPGYTVVSEIGYAVILLVMLVGVALLLKQLRIERYRAMFYGLFPFMFFGGALRVVEDVNNRAAQVRADEIASGVSPAEATGVLIDYPLNSFLISPIIYFTVFFVALGALVLAVYLSRNVIEQTYEYPLFVIASAILAVTLGYLGWASLTKEFVYFYPQVLVVVLVGATISTAVVWYLIETFKPGINRGTGLMGVVILWAHSIDGVANVVGLDWMTFLTGQANLVGKHPVNRFIVDISGGILPAYLDAFPFLIVKLVAATFVIYVFDDVVFEDSPRFTVMLLVAIVAVGLGPGTRDMLRAALYV
ncbi:DUF63 family protein [Haloarchaeobius sp. HME9146]|uniref:DUF63 family protein n=1 Tax=Haloarchaeobius sp. HME9146 TaxID=2978732 RepID=UPI0021BEEB7A|nr:DUF63 family protein [Haloarchaeobius sp. HME9146]MCT9097292.1 DUF63 family protein [Haloarchaeobius sp. HME9146]